MTFDGTNSLVVWQDSRAGADEADVYGARVNASGTVLDASGIPISTGGEFEGVPSVASTGAGSLVVWFDQRNVDANPNDPGDVFGSRVSSAGGVLDPSGIAISATTGFQGDPSIASDGTSYLVTAEDQRLGEQDLYATQVSAGGSVLNAGVSLGRGNEPAIASNGTAFFAVWTYLDDIVGRRVSAAGAAVDPADFLVSKSANRQRNPAVAFDGTNYLVVWEDLRSGGDLYGARVSPTGTMLDGSGFVISAAAGGQLNPVVGFDGTNYLVVWQDNRSGASDIYGARVSTGGTVLDGAGIAISTAASSQQDPAMVFAGTSYLVAWSDFRNGQSDVYASLVSTAGVVLSPLGTSVSGGTGTQTLPAVAFDGTNSLVVWQDPRAGNLDIFGARVNQTGVVLDAAGKQITTSGFQQLNPAVAFDGTRYLVVWQDYRLDVDHPDIYGARVNTAGSVLDAQGIQISAAANDQDLPEVTANGSFFVVWRDRRSQPDYSVYGSRVNGAGTVLDVSGVAIAASAIDEDQPAVSPKTGGAQYGVVYTGSHPRRRTARPGRISATCRRSKPDRRFITAGADCRPERNASDCRPQRASRRAAGKGSTVAAAMAWSVSPTAGFDRQLRPWRDEFRRAGSVLAAVVLLAVLVAGTGVRLPAHNAVGACAVAARAQGPRGRPARPPGRARRVPTRPR